MATLSGQITMTGNVITWASQVTLNAQSFYVSAHPNNGAPIYIGLNASDTISSTTGYPLSPLGQSVILLPASMLNELKIIGTASDKLCWIAQG